MGPELHHRIARDPELETNLTRLSWLIAQPHVHLIRYHGVLALHHAWCSEIVLRKAPEEELSATSCRELDRDF
jgi:hypothetical protein